MKLLSMTAWFGKLCGETLELHAGLNLITAPNESGKSTWAAFLRVMLYGLDTRERDKKGAPADKNHYRPWDGHPMEGELRLEFEGRIYRLKRWTEGTVPMGGFSMTDEVTGLPAEGITGQNVGEILLGVSRAVFARTAFFTQDAIAVEQSRELEQRILSLCSAGEEMVSWTDADKRLQAWLRQLSAPKGEIATRTAQQKECQSQLDALSQTDCALTDTRIALLQYTRQRDQAQEILDSAALHARIEQGRRYRAASEALNDAVDAEKRIANALCASGATPPPKPRLQGMRQECATLLQEEQSVKHLRAQVKSARLERSDAQSRAKTAPWGELDADSAWEQAHTDAARCQRMDTMVQRSRRLFPLALGISGAVGFVLSALNYRTQGWVSIVMGVVAAVVLGAILCGGLILLIRSCAAAQKNLLSVYHAKNSGEIMTLASEYHALLEISVRKQLEAEKYQRELEELNASFLPRRDALLEQVSVFAPDVTCLEDADQILVHTIGLWEQLDSSHLQVQSARQVFDAVSSAGPGLEASDVPDTTPPPTQAEVESARHQLNDALNELKRLENQQSMIQGQRRAMGDPALLSAQLETLARRLDEDNRRAAALDTARRLLNQANLRMQERFSPRLNAKAGELARRLTDGRYTRVVLSRDFALQAEEPNQLADRSAELLSRGASDQLYLAVRLALCSMVLDPEKPCPIILDDALNHFDNHRLMLALEVLDDLDTQVLLFSCTGREAALWKRKK